jgi:hypothetical protein
MPSSSKTISTQWVNKKVTIAYKGEKVTLPGTYETAEEGMRAAREYCARKGWPEDMA